MGAILDLPAAAQPFAAEARRESFYVGAGNSIDQNYVLTAARRDEGHGSFTVPLELLAAFGAALHVVATHPSARADAEVHPVAGEDPWTVTRQGQVAIFTGPVFTYGVAADLAPAQSVEIAYVHLGYLLRDVATVTP